VGNKSVHRVINAGNLFLKEKSPLFIIFIIALLLSLGLSHPQLLLNDEWITANQLSQLDQGHQFIVNEGKYGYYNETPGAYFQAHNNALGYPIFLPLISIPALKILKVFGDTFDYWLMTIWSILLIVLGLLIQKFHPGIVLYKRISLSSLLLILAFFIFILNMVFYVPFTIGSADAPREAAAIILTNDLLFAGLCVILFMTISTLFQDRRFVIFGTFLCVTSSSYLIWASSAKDHMLTIFLFSLIIFGLVTFFYSKKIRWCFFSFFFIGILAWDRPEISIFILFFLIISLLPYVIREWKISKKKRNIGYLLISPFFTVLGAIPLFINNYIVTKNPLITPYSVWSQPVFENPTLLNTSMVSTASPGITGNPAFFIDTVFSRINPHFDTFISDLIRILFSPESGSTGVFILVPVFLLGLLSIPLLIKYKPEKFTVNELYLFLPLSLITIAIFFAYLNQFPILNADTGVAPDIRYLSPVYVCLNIIGLIILSKFSYIVQRAQDLFKYVAVFFCLLIPIFIGIIFIYKHKVENFLPVFSHVSLWISVMVIIVVISSTIALCLHLKNQSKKTHLIILIGLLIALPFVWQVITIFLISNMVKGYQGYTFWLPIIRKISNILYMVL
jgi:hypothetical protein